MQITDLIKSDYLTKNRNSFVPPYLYYITSFFFFFLSNLEPLNEAVESVPLDLIVINQSEHGQPRVEMGTAITRQSTDDNVL